MDAPVASVVIPAHDEGSVIERCLRALRVHEGDLEVVVVANACRDDTAERARACGVRVVETATPGKTGALNLGDAACTVFPRAYLDADVVVNGADLRAVVEAVRRGPALAAAPALRVDLRGCSWPVRSYYRVWTSLPYVTDAMIGSGIFVLSERGRARFGAFPDVVGDDVFVRRLFQPGERVSVAGTSFTVAAPRTLSALLRTKTRAEVGNRQHRARAAAAAGDAVVTTAGDAARPAAPVPSGPGRRAVLLRRPGLWPSWPVYAAVRLATRVAARRRLASGRALGWDRDETTRSAPGV